MLASPWHILILFISLIPFALIVLLIFFAIRFFSRSPRAESEAYYNAEVIKKITESGAGSTPAIEFLREQERIKATKRTGGIKLAGLINIAFGIGLMITLAGIVGVRVALCGTIPLLVGVTLLAYALWLAPKPEA
jgi:hypothetical protein